MSGVAATLLPIGLLLLVGVVVRLTGVVSPAQATGFKQLILSVCLPAVLFLAFLSMELEVRYLYLALSTVALLSLFMGAGYLITRLTGAYPLMPYHATGFSFGFLGIPLFALVFGRENLGIYTVFGVGHELFVWFVYYPLLARRYREREEGGSSGLLRLTSFLRSPIVLAIASGLAANALGLGFWFAETTVGGAVDETLHILADATTPLILIVVGHSLSFRRSLVSTGLPVLLLRLLITFGLGYPFMALVMEPIAGSGEPLFAEAFFSLIVLPGLYSLPIFLARHGDREGERESSGVVTLGTALSVTLFLFYVAFLL